MKKIVVAAVIGLAVSSSAWAQKSPELQATESMLIYEVTAHRDWQAKATKFEADLSEAMKQTTETQAQVATLQKGLTESTASAADLQNKLKASDDSLAALREKSATDKAMPDQSSRIIELSKQLANSQIQIDELRANLQKATTPGTRTPK